MPARVSNAPFPRVPRVQSIRKFSVRCKNSSHRSQSAPTVGAPSPTCVRPVAESPDSPVGADAEEARSELDAVDEAHRDDIALVETAVPGVERLADVADELRELAVADREVRGGG